MDCHRFLAMRPNNQYCFLAGLKSVVDNKDGEEFSEIPSYIWQLILLVNTTTCTSSSVLLVCSRVQTTYLSGLLLCNCRPMHWLVFVGKSQKNYANHQHHKCAYQIKIWTI